MKKAEKKAQREEAIKRIKAMNTNGRFLSNMIGYHKYQIIYIQSTSESVYLRAKDVSQVFAIALELPYYASKTQSSKPEYINLARYGNDRYAFQKNLENIGLKGLEVFHLMSQSALT